MGFQPLKRLLVFRPKPGSDRLFYVCERFLFVFSLREAAGKGGALRDHPAVFIQLEGHMEHHHPFAPWHFLYFSPLPQ